MKFFASLLTVLIIFSACKTTKNSTEDKSATKTTTGTENGIVLNNYTDSVSYALGLLYGRSLKSQGFTDMNADILLEVFGQSLNNTLPSDEELLIADKDASPIVNAYFIKKREIMASENLAKGQAFLEENKKKEGVVTTASGLQYKVLKKGEGESPSPSSSVTVYYKGTLLDGTVFDQTKPNAPATFNVGGLIKGWQEGLLLMKPGAKFKFFVPSNLAYGHQGSQGSIGPNEALIFEVELLKVN